MKPVKTKSMNYENSSRWYTLLKIKEPLINNFEFSREPFNDQFLKDSFLMHFTNL